MVRKFFKLLKGLEPSISVFTAGGRIARKTGSQGRPRGTLDGIPISCDAPISRARMASRSSSAGNRMPSRRPQSNSIFPGKLARLLV